MIAASTTVALDELVELRLEKAGGSKDPTKPYVGLEHIAQGSPRLLGTLPSSASVSVNCIFEKDDILFGKLRPNLRKSLRISFPGYCSTDILVLRAKPTALPAYCAQLCQWERVFATASASAAGTKMPRTTWDELRRFHVFKPPTELEQGNIAEVLDTIDEAITRTEAVIAKLRQVRSGLLHDLLTRGLDANGELRDPIAHPEQFKDSPLRRIPKEWVVAPLGKFISCINQGWSPDCDSETTPAGQWGVLKTTAVQWEGYNDAENKCLPASLSPLPTYEVKNGDVLMTRCGPGDRVGVVALVNNTQGQLMLSDKLYRLVPREGVNPAYLVLMLSSSPVQKRLAAEKTGMAESQTNISHDIVRKLNVAIPDPAEQAAVVALMDAHGSQLRAENRHLGKLLSLRSGLMTDLLTGRVRVPASADTPAQ